MTTLPTKAPRAPHGVLAPGFVTLLQRLSTGGELIHSACGKLAVVHPVPTHDPERVELLGSDAASLWSRLATRYDVHLGRTLPRAWAYAEVDQTLGIVLWSVVDLATLDVVAHCSAADVGDLVARLNREADPSIAGPLLPQVEDPRRVLRREFATVCC